MKRKPAFIGLGYVVITAGLLTHPGGCAMPAPLAGGGSFAGGASDFGATQGGVQDMGLARELVASGQVPPPEAFVVEGMFSEHDLGLEGEACERVLCLRAAMGIAPTLEGESSGWMQVGLSSLIDMDTFRRSDLTLIATVDVSGSMGWDYVTEQTAYPTAGQVSRNLLSAIAAELGADDQIAIVTYGSTVNTVLPLTGGDDQVTIQAVIDGLSTGGVTDMESGLRRAYDIARSAVGESEQVRVMLFTDMQPNVGATTPTEFEQIAAEGAQDGIGLTVMGIGVGLGQELVNAVAHLRDGNAFSLFDNEDVSELMADDWPWLVSPIAYDLTLEITPPPGFTMAESYGFPSGEEEDEAAAQLDVATIFLSRRKGALLLRFSPTEGAEPADLQVTGTLAYETPAGEPVIENLDVVYGGEPLDERGQYFEQPSVAKTVALAILVSSMAEAAEVYGEDRAGAVATMQAAIERFSADAASLDDDALTAEIEFASQLLTLMEQGAEQGDLYGYGYEQW